MSADDLLHFLAVARAGRLTTAATRLQVDHTTVGRRVTALVQSAGHRLCDRSPAGWLLTPRGQALVPAAEAVERALREADHLVGTRRSALTGSVRVLCPDGFGTFLLAPALGTVRAEHPDLTLEIATATVRLEQTLRDFDVAVTLEEPRSPRVLRRPLTDYVLKLYASEGYLRDHPVPRRREDLVDHTTIWYVDQLLQVRPLHAVDRLLPRPADIQSTNVVAQWQAAAAGHGIAPLPQYLARRDPRLVQVLPDVAVHQRYWLALPRDHARLPRVQVFVDLLEQVVADRREDLLGG